MKPDECSSGLKMDALRIYFRECREDEEDLGSASSGCCNEASAGLF